MTHRKTLIAGNWKLNAGGHDGIELALAVAEATQAISGVDVVVAPPFTALAAVSASLEEASSRVEVAAQNMYAKDSGAYTGEISAPMLQAAGVKWVIIGHSERRQYFGETDDSVRAKVEACLAAGLTPIACVGETLEERESGQTLEVVFRHVDAFAELYGNEPGRGVIAYEPVWAIGTGKVASPAQAEEVHAAIRQRLSEKVSAEVAERTRILYGGSVKADNAKELLSQPNIDGALVGGAALVASGFAQIVAAAQPSS